MTSMYFESRIQAGQLLAEQLAERYRYENCAIVALTDGAVLVAEPIATALHCVVTLLVTEDIAIPGEGMSFGSVSQTGDFTRNSMLSQSELDGYTSEFHGYLAEQKREAFQRINRLVGDGGTINRDLLRDRVVILVSDGFGDNASLDAALDFLKPIRIERLVVAAPTASVVSVDQLHVTADELHILDVKANFMGVDHYYDHNDIPSHEETVQRINQIILSWQ